MAAPTTPTDLVDEGSEQLLDAITTTTQQQPAVHVLDAVTAATSAIARAELDVQVSTAKAYPRSLATFRSELRAWACSVQSIAEECTYQLPRGGKSILGPSIRFAELVQVAWGNLHVDVMVLSGDADDHVVVMATGRDLERNTVSRVQVRRSVVDRNGKRFQQHMVETTIAAATAIARRNVILQLVPKALWLEVWEGSKSVMLGQSRSQEDRVQATVAAMEGEGLALKDAEAWLGGSKPKRRADWNNDDLVSVALRVKAVRDGTCAKAEAFPAAKPDQVDRRNDGQDQVDDVQSRLDSKAKTKAKD